MKNFMKIFGAALFASFLILSCSSDKSDGISANEYWNIGLQKMGLGEKDYTGAIADFSKAIELDPENKYAYYSRGTAKYELEDYRGYIADYSKAIEITPKNASAY